MGIYTVPSYPSVPTFNTLQDAEIWARKLYRTLVDEAFSRLESDRIPIDRVSSFTLADDTAISITPLYQVGIFIIHSSLAAGVTAAGIINYRTQDVAATSIVATNAAVTLEVTTGVLEGTTGSNGKFTVSAHTDFKIYIENRLGFPCDFRGVFIF